jgi:hypothetical protein
MASYLGLPKPKSPMQYADFIAFQKSVAEEFIKRMNRIPNYRRA